jgi:aspartyl-tRNA(Asn)/glutamyl-tRNA(Gln) amidotransferase subunit C
MAKPTIDENLTRNVAHLARLDLTDEEVRTFTNQLSQVIGYMEQLQEIELGGVEPMTHPLELETPLREDVVRPSPVDAEGLPRTLSPAPDTLDGGFKVPPIL